MKTAYGYIRRTGTSVLVGFLTAAGFNVWLATEAWSRPLLAFNPMDELIREQEGYAFIESAILLAATGILAKIACRWLADIGEDVLAIRESAELGKVPAESSAS